MKKMNESGFSSQVTRLSKYLSLVLWSLFFFIVFGVQQLYSWPLVKTSGWGGGSSFIDLRSVLHAAECSERIGWDIYDPNKWGDCGYIYGSLLVRLIRWTHLSPALTVGVGWVFIFLFSLLAGYIFSNLKKLTRLQVGLCVVIFVSPGAMLLLERGNFDILLILLLFAAAFFLQKKWSGIGISIIAFSALLKFYTIPLLFVVTLFLHQRRRIITSLLGSIVVTILVLRDLLGIKGEFPDNVMASFGNQIFAGYLNYTGFSIPRFYRELIGLLGILICTQLIWRTGKIKLIKIVQHFQSKNSYAVTDYIIGIFSCSYLICFFAGLNYDYRIPYLSIPTLLLLPILIQYKPVYWPVLVSLILICWTSYNVGVLQVIGDICVLFLTSFWIVLYFIYTKSANPFLQLRKITAPSTKYS